MDRDVWMMAASLLGRHGMDALVFVNNKLMELNRWYVEGAFREDDAAAMNFWRETGKAILAIVETEPSGPHSIN